MLAGSEHPGRRVRVAKTQTLAAAAAALTPRPLRRRRSWSARQHQSMLLDVTTATETRAGGRWAVGRVVVEGWKGRPRLLGTQLLRFARRRDAVKYGGILTVEGRGVGVDWLTYFWCSVLLSVCNVSHAMFASSSSSASCNALYDVAAPNCM